MVINPDGYSKQRLTRLQAHSDIDFLVLALALYALNTDAYTQHCWG